MIKLSSLENCNKLFSHDFDIFVAGTILSVSLL
jgi:hypothetical protein